MNQLKKGRKNKPGSNLQKVNEAIDKEAELYESELLGEKSNLLGSLADGMFDSGVTGGSDVMAQNILRGMEEHMKEDIQNEEVYSVLSDEEDNTDFIGNFNKKKKPINTNEKDQYQFEGGTDLNEEYTLNVRKPDDSIEESFSSESDDDGPDSTEYCEYNFKEEGHEVDKEKLLGDSIAKGNEENMRVVSATNLENFKYNESFKTHSSNNDSQKDKFNYSTDPNSESNEDFEDRESIKNKQIKSKTGSSQKVRSQFSNGENPSSTMELNNIYTDQYLKEQEMEIHKQIKAKRRSVNVSVQGNQNEDSIDQDLNHSDSMDKETRRKSRFMEEKIIMNQDMIQPPQTEKFGTKENFEFENEKYSQNLREIPMSNKNISSQNNLTQNENQLGRNISGDQFSGGQGTKEYIGSARSHSDLDSADGFNNDIDMDIRNDVGYGRYGNGSSNSEKDEFDRNEKEDEDYEINAQSKINEQLKMELAEMEKEKDIRESLKIDRKRQHEIELFRLGSIF